MPRWNSSDNKKLSDLFRKGPRSNGVDPKALDAKSVEAAREEFFPSNAYKNFAPIFRKNARAWNLEHIRDKRPENGESFQIQDLFNLLNY